MSAAHLVEALSRDMLELPRSPRIIFEWDDHAGEWIAFWDGFEHVGPFGRGASKASAEANLEDNFGDGTEWSR